MVTGKGSVYSNKIANGVFSNGKEKKKDAWVIVFTVICHRTQDDFRKYLWRCRNSDYHISQSCL